MDPETVLRSYSGWLHGKVSWLPFSSNWAPCPSEKRTFPQDDQLAFPYLNGEGLKGSDGLVDEGLQIELVGMSKVIIE